jgi:hypothetical protein
MTGLSYHEACETSRLFRVKRIQKSSRFIGNSISSGEMHYVEAFRDNLQVILELNGLKSMVVSLVGGAH